MRSAIVSAGSRIELKRGRLNEKGFVVSCCGCCGDFRGACGFRGRSASEGCKSSSGSAAEPVGYRLRQRVMSDYVWRGVTQSAHQPSVAAYFEPRYNINSNWQLYAGISGESIKFANNAAAEIDMYGGIRPTWGPLAIDFGFWYYDYPGGMCYGTGPPRGWIRPATRAEFSQHQRCQVDASFYEVYAKVDLHMGDWAFGWNFYYTPNFLNTGADGEYLSGTIKWTAAGQLALVQGFGVVRIG